MKVIRGGDIRNHAKDLLGEVVRGETIFISRPFNQNVVIISEAAYNQLQKAAEEIKERKKKRAEHESEVEPEQMVTEK